VRKGFKSHWRVSQKGFTSAKGYGWEKQEQGRGMVGRVQPRVKSWKQRSVKKEFPFGEEKPPLQVCVTKQRLKAQHTDQEMHSADRKIIHLWLQKKSEN